ncbi:MAG: helix-turn-helix domain-containing protein [Ruminococcaceae bacterium]|nr:helix-turn-helix domain-containing protein [Oscillospiraceae bacterium]
MKSVPIAKFDDKQKKPINLFADKRITCKSIPHSHNHYELEMIASGSGESVLNGEKIELKRGSVYILKPSDVHSLCALPDKSLEIMNISFLEGTFFKELSVPVLFGKKVNIAVLDEEDINMVLSVFMVMENEQQKGKPDVGIMQGCANVILRIIMRKMDWDFTPKRQDELADALHFISENFCDHIDLTSVARHVGFTPQYFSKIFHQRIGKSFKKYLSELRITYAVKLMKYNGFNSTEAAFECGYNSYSAFLKAFKEHTGVLPKNYMMYKDEM